MEKKPESLQSVLNNEQFSQFAALDNIAVKGINAIAIKIALGLELFIPPRETRILYPQMETLLENYYERFQLHLNYYGSPKTGKILKLSDKFQDKMRNVLLNYNYEAYYQPYIFYDDQNKGDLFNATPWVSSFFGHAPEDSKLSALSAMMGVRQDGENLNIDTLLEMTFQWCNTIHPAHGSAGFCFAYTLGREAAKYAWPLMTRHPGIDYHNKTSFILQSKNIFNKIKGVNWLTILSEQLIEELGGISYCKKQVEPLCHIEPYNGGVIIIAGPCPQIGDNHKNIELEPYKKVAKLTRPVRMENYEYNFLELNPPLDSFQEFENWLRRFD